MIPLIITTSVFSGYSTILADQSCDFVDFNYESSISSTGPLTQVKDLPYELYYDIFERTSLLDK